MSICKGIIVTDKTWQLKVKELITGNVAIKYLIFRDGKRCQTHAILRTCKYKKLDTEGLRLRIQH